jgi:hypothetical protein
MDLVELLDSHDIALIWLSKRGFSDTRGGVLV